MTEPAVPPGSEHTTEVAALVALIRRALHQLDVPAYHGPGSVWADMVDAVADFDESAPSYQGELRPVVGATVLIRGVPYEVRGYGGTSDGEHVQVSLRRRPN